MQGEGQMSRKSAQDDHSSLWFILTILFGILTFIFYQVYSFSDSAYIFFLLAMTSVAAFAFLLIGCFSYLQPNQGEKSRQGSISGTPIQPRLTCHDLRLREMAEASQKLYEFFEKLNVNAKFQHLLDEQPSLNQLGMKENTFSVDNRLALIVYCDLRDCFQKLGYDSQHLQGLIGIGYAMIISQLLVHNFQLSKFYVWESADRMLRMISEFDSSTKIKMEISGHEDEFRLSVLAMTVGEYEWVQQYAILLYRWASVLARADGEITEKESETLSAIMDMKELKQRGNVKISNSVQEIAPSDDNFFSSTTSSRTGKKKESLDEVVARLDDLVGLEPVKNEVKTLMSFIQIQKQRRLSGLKETPISYHCVFTGNPGTGKTTVARILADIYREMGVVKKGQLVETDRSGLIAEYVGQTAVKTNKVIDSALDGVLFIDEAYSLVQGDKNDFGHEAIATLLKRMEDDRDRLIVILAGYTGEMKKFIDSNPGLQSRFNRYVEFPDYSAEELSEIFLSIAQKNQYQCDSEVLASLNEIMAHAIAQKDKNFGNGRFVRNLFEKSIQRQAVRLSRISPLTTEMLTTLNLCDLGFYYS